MFLHASGARAPDAAWVEALASSGLELFSHHPLEGVQRTEATVDGLGDLCRELSESAPGAALLLLRCPIVPSPAVLEDLERLAATASGPRALAPLSNAEEAVNPYAGLDVGETDARSRERLVALLGTGRLLPVDAWTGHCLVLSREAVDHLAESGLSWHDAPGRLRSHGATLQVADWLYVELPGRDPARETALEPHEERRPPPWGALGERLQAWLGALGQTPGIAHALPRPGDAPVTLHITHSWGGGVAAWVDSCIAGDPSGLHLQLRSEGPQSGQGAGQRLGLYLGNLPLPALGSWWLQPPIRAVSTEHGAYREILERICERFAVGRLMVSSLIGHSLDALRTGRPTVQIVHDAFPAWPLLSVHPQEYGDDLDAAMADPRAGEQFPEVTREDWRRIGAAYGAATDGVQRVAPSASARDVQLAVDPPAAGRDIAVIPHGLPPLEGPAIRPRPRDDGRLRVVIPGRVLSGKGAALLEAALPDLTRIAQVTLLGTGKGGERFFGRGGVNVILQYDRDELPALLQRLGPQLALLPSVVPETFSYTLSEMFALGVPVVATRLGSFAERIEDGITGWLVEPDAAALAACLQDLARRPEALQAVRDTLGQRSPRTLQEMVSDYDRLCPARPLTPRRPMGGEERSGTDRDQADARLDQLRRSRTTLAAARQAQARLEAELAERTRWARDVKRELAQVRQERDTATARGEHLDEELSQRASHIEVLDQRVSELSTALDSSRAEAAALRAETASLEQQLTELHERLDGVLSSHSWKLTLPLRVSRRVAANIVQTGAWNPLRWPLLVSQTVRNLSTVGLRGTLQRMQYYEPEAAPTSSAKPAAPLALPAEINLPGAFPRADAPAVSIVVPAFNHLAHTAACLSSVAAARCEASFEVIVVDDASSDETGERLAAVDGLRLLRNEENQGFIRSCNRGASEARGDFVLFLNNDTQVEDGWLDALLDTFALRPDAGLVGARLVYPDGRLQECGGMVFSDGSGWNYGRGDDPDRPEYQALREVDYCSGACIVLRRTLFDRLGGFDEHYAPAYYEDTDLAFRVRAEGLRVYVQPRATVTHFEGVSSGTDPGSGTKRYQAVNREKFLARWAEALALQPAPIENPEDLAAVRRARDHRLAGRVLVVDAYTPEPDQDSGSVRLVNLMGCLRDLGYGVSFFADNRAWRGRYTLDLQAMGVEAWYDPWLTSAARFLADRGRDFSHVIVSRHYVATHYLPLVRRHAPDASFLFDTVDLHYLREQRQAELEDSTALRQTARQTRRSELGVIRAADATLVVSPVEQALLAEEVPEARVFILSNIHELADEGLGFAERSDLYFVGGYQHPPNIDAATWFVGDIWPRIRERLPGVRFHLVGSKATEEVRALGAAEGVEFHGFVESLAPFLDRCRLSVAPLRYGAGVKGKVNQAMAHGQPVVATPAAVEGIHARDGEDVLVAEDAGAFADAVVRLYEDADLWRTLADNGRHNVVTHFSRDAARRNLRALFTALGEDAGP